MDDVKKMIFDAPGDIGSAVPGQAIFTALVVDGHTITGAGATLDSIIITGEGTFGTVDATDGDFDTLTVTGESHLGTLDAVAGSFSTLDATVIGGVTPGVGNFTTIDGIYVDSSYGSFGTLMAVYVNIEDGTIDGTEIGAVTPAIGNFSQAKIGTAATYTDIGVDGAITFVGLVRHLAMRPAFVAGVIAKTIKPTSETVGVFSGYSLPVHNDDGEELFWRLSVPGRWNGTDNITYYIIACLATAETVDKTFQIQLSWNGTDGITSAIPTTAISVAVLATCATLHNVQYAVHKLTFTIDPTAISPTLAAGNVLGARVRRITSGGTEIANRIIVFDHWLDFVVDKVFKHV
jgi:hypothetical protein